MLRSPMTWAGFLFLVAGTVWLLQGLGLLAGSAMTGVTGWVYIGGLTAAVGMGLLIVSARRSWH